MVRASIVVAGIVSVASLGLAARQGAAPAPPATPAQGAVLAPGQPREAAVPRLQNPNAHYAWITMTLDVKGPVDKVWARVGKSATSASGALARRMHDRVGQRRRARRRAVGDMILVGKTDHWYTYTQPVRATGIYNMYHGTLEAKALTPTTTQLVYSLFFDNSQLSDDAARDTDIANRRTRVSGWLRA